MVERVTGDVFHYPYLWAHEHARGIDNSRDRTACLVFSTRNGAGEMQLVILAISDRQPENNVDAVEVPEIELRRGGLNPARRAFVHIAEYNTDILPLSVHHNPASRSFGRFSRAFTEHVARALAANIRLRRSRRLARD